MRTVILRDLPDLPGRRLAAPAECERSDTPAPSRLRLVSLALVVGTVCLSIAFPRTARSAEDASRPNLVILLADDQGWGDVSSHGNRNLQTPHMDALAREGASLERFFVCPVCSPTRAEFLTGRYHSRGGVRGVTAGQERLNTDESTIAESFRAAGYATGAFGKWHNGSQWPYHPNARGIEEYYGFTSGHWGEYFNPPLEHNGVFVRGKGFIADDLTDHALAFIEANKNRPFFCYVPYNTPHSPFCVPDEYWNRFKDKPIELRGHDGDREALDVTRAALALCENVDANVGRVLRKLDELGLRENTIVVYFSDNGPNSTRWNGGMKGRKGSTDEGGVRAPCFVRWPARIKAGVRVPQIAGAIDLLPTLTSLAGVTRVGDKPLDGRDISSLLFRRDAAWPDRMIFSHFAGRVSVRTQQYRLDDRGALFDMAADPEQTTDIAMREPAVASRLRDAVAEWRSYVLPTAKGDDRPYPVGYAEFPTTPLPARDGVASGTVRRSSGAPNCSYFVHWTSLEDRITWDVDVHTAGDYEATVYYTCPAADVGSTVELSLGASRLGARVGPAWDPPLITGEDRVPRKGESTMKEFHPLSLGVLRLEQGRGSLTLRAVNIAGQTVMDVRLLTLTLK